jgi:hypothetical protein
MLTGHHSSLVLSNSYLHSLCVLTASSLFYVFSLPHLSIGAHCITVCPVLYRYETILAYLKLLTVLSASLHFFFVARRPKPILYCRLIYLAVVSWLGNQLRHNSGTVERKGGTRGINRKVANRNVGLINKHVCYFSTGYFKNDLNEELTFPKILHKQGIISCVCYSFASDS